LETLVRARKTTPSVGSVAVALACALAFQCAASAASATDAAQSESVSVDRLIRDANSYVLQVPDADRYRLRHSADWVLKSQSAPAVVKVAPAPPAPVVTLPRALVRKRFEAEIATAAKTVGLDPALVHAVIGVESAYREHAISPKGAVGLMQVMPETGRRYGVENLTLPSQNIRAGTRYLSDLMRLFNGDLALVLAAYNAGENAVIRHGRRVPPYPETLQYVPRVLGIYRALGGSTQAPPEVR
jgi:soluble lytic murein transglycosylase-like protein